MSFNGLVGTNCRRHVYYGSHIAQLFPDSKVHRATMGPIWGREDPGGPHVVPINLVIRVMYVTRDTMLWLVDKFQRYNLHGCWGVRDTPGYLRLTILFHNPLNRGFCVFAFKNVDMELFGFGSGNICVKLSAYAT